MARRLTTCVGAAAAVLLISACAGQTTGTTNITAYSADLHATASCAQGEICTWYWEYWPASGPRSASTKTPVYGPANGPTGNVALTQYIAGLQPDTTYRWVFCGSPNGGAGYVCTGPNGQPESTTADPPPSYETFTTDTATWTIQSTPNPSGATSSYLVGASCTAASACTAVGDSGTTSEAGSSSQTLAETWNGMSWTIQSTPNASGENANQLVSVSCTPDNYCTAVGNDGTSSETYNTQQTLAEQWNGSSWTIQSTTNPSGSTSSSLAAVSCTSGSACAAVGGYSTQSNSSGLPLAETWNGMSWTIRSVPLPSGATYGTLYGVSCTSGTACVAVGSYANSPGTAMTLAESWNGTSWRIMATPNPSGETSSTLAAVSCASTSACNAVGWTRSSGLLAEQWNGSSWTIQSVPTPSGVTELKAVSCTSAVSCTAVGINGSTGSALAEHWDGDSWVIQSTPSPGDSALDGVSCVSTTVCDAVGDQPNNSNFGTLAEGYSG